jgi:hypothetical protein
VLVTSNLCSQAKLKIAYCTLQKLMAWIVLIMVRVCIGFLRNPKCFANIIFTADVELSQL